MSRGGHNKKSEHLKLLQGTLKKSRINPKAPQIKRGILKPSRGLAAVVKKEFEKLVVLIGGMGILSVEDGGELESLAIVRVQIQFSQKMLFQQTERKAYRQWQLILNDAIRISSALSLKFGLSPSDRGRVSVISEEGENPWADL